MGFTPQDVDAMSPWQLAACLEGFAKANGAEDRPEPPSDEEFLNWYHGRG